MQTDKQLGLFPEIEPYQQGMLSVDEIHTIYWEQSGNPEGVPVVFLHGGPGAGSTSAHRQFLIRNSIGLSFWISVVQGVHSLWVRCATTLRRC